VLAGLDPPVDRAILPADPLGEALDVDVAVLGDGLRDLRIHHPDALCHFIERQYAHAARYLAG